MELTPTILFIDVDGNRMLGGKLYARIKREDSIWLLEDGLLHVNMLKSNRKGHYADGCTNADTFWFSLFQGRSGADRLPLTYPPDNYYRLDAVGQAATRATQSQQMLTSAA